MDKKYLDLDGIRYFFNKLNILKQDTLTAGNGISIDNNIISVVGGTGGGDSAPIGSVFSYCGLTAPENYLVCDGATYNTTDYLELATLLGATGDTFNVPNLIDKFIKGSTTVGNTGGSASVSHTHTNPTTGSTAISINQMPSHTHVQNAHTHTQNAHGHSFTVNGYKNGSASGTSSSDASSSIFDHTAYTSNTTATNQNTTATNQNTGGGQGHTHSMGNTGEATINTEPPYYTMVYIVKAK